MSAVALWPILAALGASGIFALAQGVGHGRAGSRWAEQQEQLLALDAPGQSACSAISGSDRMPCGTHQIGQAECAALGCCFNPQSSLAPCYYAGKVTAHCTPDGEFSIAVSKDATVPELSLDHIRPRSSQGGQCAPVAQNGRFALFRFSVSACGTTFKASGSRHIYENVLQTDQRVLASRSGSVTWGSDFRLTVRCSYLAEEALPASVVMATFPPPVVVAQQGPLTLEMRISHDEKYSSFYSEDDYPVVKLLRDPVYVEVRLLGRADPALILVLHECWATSSTSPLQRPEWPLLVSGCPYKGDNYQTRRLPLMAVTALRFPSHHQHFVIRTFTSADVHSQRMLRGPVYLHCSTSACLPSGKESCQASCEEAPQSRKRRDPGDLPLTGEWLMLVTSSGPVEFFDKANAVSVQESEEEVSRLLPQGGIGRWDDVLFLVAGTVGILAVSVIVIVILRKHWRRLQTLGGPPCA